MIKIGIPARFALFKQLLQELDPKKGKFECFDVDSSEFSLGSADKQCETTSVYEVFEALQAVAPLKKRFPGAKQTDEKLAMAQGLELALSLCELKPEDDQSFQITEALRGAAAEFLAERYYVCSGSVFFVIDLLLLTVLRDLIVVVPEASLFTVAPVARYVDFVQTSISNEGFKIEKVELFKKLNHPLSIPKLPAKKQQKPDAKKGDKQQQKKQQQKQQQQPKGEKKQKTEKKQKPKKQAPPPATPLDVGDANLIVGKVISVRSHPDAERLFVEEIDCGEDKPRTICSGLKAFVPEEELNGSLVLVAANLKPVKMRGIVSAGMVMCASNEDHSAVELLKVPENAKPGDRVTFEGFENHEVRELRPKKKEWEQLAPHFTLVDGVVSWKEKTCSVAGEKVYAKTMKTGTVG